MLIFVVLYRLFVKGSPPSKSTEPDIACNVRACARCGIVGRAHQNAACAKDWGLEKPPRRPDAAP